MTEVNMEPCAWTVAFRKWVRKTKKRPAAIARELGVSRSRVHRWLVRGVMPCRENRKLVQVASSGAVRA